jgi:hypothetical protein
MVTFPPEIQSLVDKVEELGERMLKISQVWVGENERAYKVMKAKVRGIILPHEAAGQMLEIAVDLGVTRFPEMETFAELSEEVTELAGKASELIHNYYG